MNIDDIMHSGRRINDRLCNAVARKLDLPDESVSIARWEPTGVAGQTVPVFRMPAGLVPVARTLGLHAEGWAR